MCFFSAQLHAMRSDPDYVRWPSALSVGPSWWELRVRVTDRDCSELVNPNLTPTRTPTLTLARARTRTRTRTLTLTLTLTRWELGDNWECTVIFAAVYPPFVAASLAFSIGGAYRRPVLRNLVRSSARPSPDPNPWPSA